MKTYEFDALILKKDSIDAAYIEFPYDVEKEFNTKGQVKVKVTFDGYKYRGSLAKMGHHCHILGITKAIRKAIGKNPGDKVHVILQKDDEPRVVEIPEDLKEQFDKNKEVKDFFDTLSYTNKKSYVQWITSAKKKETRERRLNETMNMLLRKEKRL